MRRPILLRKMGLHLDRWRNAYPFVVVLCVFLLTLSFLIAVKGQEASPDVDDGLPREEALALAVTRPESTLLVAVLDGSLHALDADTGELKWSFSSGPPLVSASRRHNAVQRADEDRLGEPAESEKVEEEEEGMVFPGADGALYAYRRGHGVQKLPITARELVQASPSMTHDGGIVVGARQSTVFMVDAASGKLLKKFDASTGTFEAVDGGDLTAPDDLKVGEVDECIYVGEQEELEQPDHADRAAEVAAEGPSGMSCQHRPLFVVRTDYNVKSMDAVSGLERWNLSMGELSTLYNPAAWRFPTGSLPPPVVKDEPHIQTSTGRGSKVSDPSVGAGAVKELPEGRGMNLEGGQDNSLRRLDSTAEGEQWRVVFPAPPVAVFSPTGELLQELVPSRRGPADRSPGWGRLTGKAMAVRDNPNTGPLQLPAPIVVQEERKAEGVPGDCNPGDWWCSSPVSSFNSGGGGERGGEVGRKREPGWLGAVTSAVSYVLVVVVVGLGSWYGRSAYGLWLERKGKNENGGVVSEAKKTPKKKKARKNPSGGNDAAANGTHSGEGKELTISARKEGGGLTDGLRVGRLKVSSKIIGYGSHGTLVLEGELEGRQVAVKRLLGQFYEKATKEIANLVISDEHPNVVRCYAMEEDGDFVYVALERCKLSVFDLIQGDETPASGDPPGEPSTSGGVRNGRARRGAKGEEWVLWDERDRPTETLQRLLKDMVSGLAHLHALGIVHRDLKPQNVLISVAGRAKLSDMGISKRLLDEQSSFDPHATGAGSSGWQAPEQLLHGRQTRAVDLFSLGCVLFFCITGGRHPFGERFERDSNVLKGEPDLWPLQHMPEAAHLVGALLRTDPLERPTAEEALLHPFFWSAEKRLAFLRDASDRVELEDREEGSLLLAAMESVGQSAAIGAWDVQLDKALLENLGKYRRYNSRSIRDLLRVIRNKCNHYRELPQSVKELLGPLPDGFLSYFTGKFPHLLMEVYKVLYTHCKQEDVVGKYFRNVHIQA